jgi:hypothetical protein
LMQAFVIKAAVVGMGVLVIIAGSIAHQT